MGMRVMLYLS